MNDQTRMQRRRFAVIAISAITACTTAACSKNTGIEATNSTAPVAKVLTLGQPSPPQEVTKNGKFTIAPTKVVEGKPDDLKELHDGKFDGQKIVWIYVRAKNVGGTVVKDPATMKDVGAETTLGSPATSFILIADLSTMPKDCKRFDAAENLESADIWKKGEERTVCEPYLIPANTKVNYVTYAQGYYDEPLKWSVK
ncbi:hypothetical protein [Streptomyces decoyicus]